MVSSKDIQIYEIRLKEERAKKATIIQCSKCNGSGVFTRARGAVRDAFRKCPACQGNGSLRDKDGIYSSNIVCMSELFYKGYTRLDIKEMLTFHFNISEKTALRYVSEAFSFVEAQHLMKKHEILSVHYRRYENIYRKYEDIDIESIPKHLRGLKMFEAISIQIETLQSKEKAFGIHGKNFMDKIKQFNITRKRIETRNKYDFTKLSLDELTSIKRIFEEAKKRSQTKIETVSKEVADKKEETEVNKLARTNSQQFAYDNPIQTVVKIEQKVILELEKSKTLEVVQRKLKETIKKQMIEKLKLAGSKTAKDE